MDAADTRVYLDFEYWRVACPDCGVRQERLPWLSSTRRATQRFAQEIGRQCRELSEARVAAMHQMSWGQVRRLDMAYMEDLLAKHPPAKRIRAIGMDEVSVRRGQSYAIVVADLDRLKPVWMSEAPGRTEEDLDKFFVGLNPPKPPRHQAGGHGHVETVSEFHPEPRPQRPDRLRQVPHPPALGGRLGRGSASGIQTRQ